MSNPSPKKPSRMNSSSSLAGGSNANILSHETPMALESSTSSNTPSPGKENPCLSTAKEEKEERKEPPKTESPGNNFSHEQGLDDSSKPSAESSPISSHSSKSPTHKTSFNLDNSGLNMPVPTSFADTAEERGALKAWQSEIDFLLANRNKKVAIPNNDAHNQQERSLPSSVQNLKSYISNAKTKRKTETDSILEMIGSISSLNTEHTTTTSNSGNQNPVASLPSGSKTADSYDTSPAPSDERNSILSRKSSPAILPSEAYLARDKEVIQLKPPTPNKASNFYLGNRGQHGDTAALVASPEAHSAGNDAHDARFLQQKSPTSSDKQGSSPPGPSSPTNKNGAQEDTPDPFYSPAPSDEYNNLCSLHDGNRGNGHGHTLAATFALSPTESYSGNVAATRALQLQSPSLSSNSPDSLPDMRNNEMEVLGKEDTPVIGVRVESSHRDRASRRHQTPSRAAARNATLDGRFRLPLSIAWQWTVNGKEKFYTGKATEYDPKLGKWLVIYDSPDIQDEYFDELQMEDGQDNYNDL